MAYKKIMYFPVSIFFATKISALDVPNKTLFGGSNYDQLYHTVNAQTFYRNSTKTQSINKKYIRTLPTEYIGIMYFHLKRLKKEFVSSGYKEFDVISFDEFCSDAFHQRLRSQLNLYERMLCALHDFDVMRRLKYKLTGTSPRYNQLRLARLADDLSGIDFERDALQWLS